MDTKQIENNTPIKQPTQKIKYNKNGTITKPSGRPFKSEQGAPSLAIETINEKAQKLGNENALTVQKVIQRELKEYTKRFKQGDIPELLTPAQLKQLSDIPVNNSKVNASNPLKTRDKTVEKSTSEVLTDIKDLFTLIKGIQDNKTAINKGETTP